MPRFLEEGPLPHSEEDLACNFASLTLALGRLGQAARLVRAIFCGKRRLLVLAHAGALK